MTSDLFELKIGTPVTPTLGKIHTNFGFSTPFGFGVKSLYGYGTDG